jgi:prenylcysteine oxidase/farnesylcysteine lyase
MSNIPPSVLLPSQVPSQSTLLIILMMTRKASLLLVFLATCLLVPVTAQKQNIAIIGGGISGTFTAKYLSDYDSENCMIESLTIFDPFPIGEPTSLSDSQDEAWQGNRISSLQLDDGRVVEIGASVFHEANRLVKEMITNDPNNNLEMGRPFNVGKEVKDIPTRQGLGVYAGDGEFAFMMNSSAPLNIFWTFVRYNLDLIKVSKATEHAITRFSTIVDLLESNQPDTFFQSPDEMWQRVGLAGLVHYPYNALLDHIGVSSEDSWFNRIVPYQGSLRAELLTAINLINYNQLNSQVNGLVGLVSFAASKGPLYSVVGGNHQIVKSAFQQAQLKSEKNCQKEGSCQT